MADDWQQAIGPGIKVVLGGSLVSKAFVQTGNDPIDLDIRFLTDDPASDYPKVEAATGLTLRKQLQVIDHPAGTSTAFMVEGAVTRDGITYDVEAAVRTPAYSGVAQLYSQVLTEREQGLFRADKALLKGDKKAYKALKVAVIEEVKARAQERGLASKMSRRIDRSAKDDGFLTPWQLEHAPFVLRELDMKVREASRLRRDRRDAAAQSPAGALLIDLTTPGFGEHKALLKLASSKVASDAAEAAGLVIRPGKSVIGVDGFVAGVVMRDGTFRQDSWANERSIAGAYAAVTMRLPEARLYANPGRQIASAQAFDIASSILRDDAIVSAYGPMTALDLRDALYALPEARSQGVDRDVAAGLDGAGLEHFAGSENVVLRTAAAELLRNEAANKAKYNQDLADIATREDRDRDEERASNSSLLDYADAGEHARREADVDYVFRELPALTEAAVHNDEISREAESRNNEVARYINDATARDATRGWLVPFWRAIIEKLRAGPVFAAWDDVASDRSAFTHGKSRAVTTRAIASAYEVTFTKNGDDITVSGKNGSLDITGATDRNPVIRSTEANSSGKKSGGGTALYQAAYHWAHANNKTIYPDTSLSSINILRKTSAMLSSALRFGSIKHVVPSEEQGLPDNFDDIPFPEQVAASALKEAALVRIRFLSYDRLLLTDDGRILYGDGYGGQQDISGPDGLASLASGAAPGPGTTGIGTGTLARALLTDAAASEVGADGDAGRLATKVGALRSVVSGGILYSRRIGRPDLANPGSTAQVRAQVDAADEFRNQAGEPKPRALTVHCAEAMEPHL